MVIGCCLQEQDHGERCDRDDGPEDDAQHQRLEAYLADYLYGEPSADQEQRGRKSAACGDRNAVRELGRQVAVGGNFFEFIFALTGPSGGVFRGGDFVGKKRLIKRKEFEKYISENVEL